MWSNFRAPVTTRATLSLTISENSVQITLLHENGYSSKSSPAFFIYSSIHINNKKMKTFNVYISEVWTKWPTQVQGSYVPL